MTKSGETMENWQNKLNLDNKSFICGYCGRAVQSDRGYSDSLRHVSIYICPCGEPTFFNHYGIQYPGVAFGNKLTNIPEDVGSLYNEARQCTASNSYTAAVLCCRKLLMHIAVDKGEEAGKNFVEYVNYLSEHHYIPPDGKGWVDYIRQKGNEANHEIMLMNQEDAINIINFTEMLLKFIYEFPSKIINIKKPK
jgi:Domain of unknown function (DUF4145)